MILPYAVTAKWLHHLPLPTAKLRESIRGRVAAASHWTRWARERRVDGGLVWIHGASVGEGLAAQPVAAALRALVPDLQIIYTHTSPSASGWPGSFGADAAGFAPDDDADDLAAVFHALRPSLLLISCADLWPRLLRAAAARAVPIANIGGGLREDSLRLRWPARQYFARLCQHVAYVGATSEGEASLWSELGVPTSLVRVTGDPRDDGVLLRTPRLDVVEPLRHWARHRRVLVAGSTDETDHEILLEGMSAVRRSGSSAGMVLVPHEPSRDVAARVLDGAERRGLPACVSIGDATDQSPVDDVIVLNATGVLYDLYLLADLAYVGGGFRRRGLHSILEPAAFAIPTIVGPYASDIARPAAFLEQGALMQLDKAAPAATLTRFWSQAVETSQRVGLAGRALLSGGSAGVIGADLVERFGLGKE